MTAAPWVHCERCGHERQQHGNTTIPTSECHAYGCTCPAYVAPPFDLHVHEPTEADLRERRLRMTLALETPQPVARAVPSTWSVLRARLQAVGDDQLIAKLAPEADAYRCPTCGEGDPVVALTEPGERLVMVCLSCNRDAFERSGFEVPK